MFLSYSPQGGWTHHQARLSLALSEINTHVLLHGKALLRFTLRQDLVSWDYRCEGRILITLVWGRLGTQDLSCCQK